MIKSRWCWCCLWSEIGCGKLLWLRISVPYLCYMQHTRCDKIHNSIVLHVSKWVHQWYKQNSLKQDSTEIWRWLYIFSGCLPGRLWLLQITEICLYSVLCLFYFKINRTLQLNLDVIPTNGSPMLIYHWHYFWYAACWGFFFVWTDFLVWFGVFFMGSVGYRSIFHTFLAPL